MKKCKSERWRGPGIGQGWVAREGHRQRQNRFRCENAILLEHDSTSAKYSRIEIPRAPI
ncbi:hypothetical protein X777_01652 [Ooceraea biroi]|uniref:Uncharacterized protein n=1 Tax=Ooceraea biroi TaxID=2015173 RepID=A0A026WN24_OOCBI|nr:hypothetical protein X777_01652 [Ooceraea biroi]